MKKFNKLPKFLKNCNGIFTYTAKKNNSINISIQSKNVRHFTLKQIQNINLDKFIEYINNIRTENIDSKQRFNSYLCITDKNIQHEQLYQTIIVCSNVEHALILDIPTYFLEQISL